MQFVITSPTRASVKSPKEVQRAPSPTPACVDLSILPRSHFTAILFSARLPAADVNAILVPARVALQAMRQGAATEEHWAMLAGAMNLAHAIEQIGIVRGLGEHLQVANRVLLEIHQKATTADGSKWCAHFPSWYQLESLDTAIDLHQFQLENLSRGELRRAVRRAVSNTTKVAT
ncbi:MAG: hypothetical protein J0H69_19665 [Burkholderiales bacterium]|nr:hypothetical protein [Burkholderiales bacterium]